MFWYNTSLHLPQDHIDHTVLKVHHFYTQGNCLESTRDEQLEKLIISIKKVDKYLLNNQGTQKEIYKVTQCEGH